MPLERNLGKQSIPKLQPHDIRKKYKRKELLQLRLNFLYKCRIKKKNMTTNIIPKHFYKSRKKT